ncbi:ferritin-like domain-containing protein [Collimonas humicola]|uniref:ferritin-like domain-containing protein n=1 Tax=Collimonas humicola TaxID=2825886 RepID=UPI001E3335F8|nr:ferritin-like domain-containing protein [Collimonas humicola]
MNQPPDSCLAIAAHAKPELRMLALQCLCEADVAAKVAAVEAMAVAWDNGGMILAADAALSAAAAIPGRPSLPALVPPREVKHRSMATVEGRAAMIHALAHIEFNAINLALDAIWRFAGMPPGYYADWLKVAREEAYHFSLLARHLQTLGYSYGDFSAHNSLWELTEKTSDDIVARMALVPRMMEARGLDASPRTRAKLAQAGDEEAAAIIDIILRDEIGHVAIGNRWYGWLCQRRQLEPLAAFAALAVQYKAPILRGPFNLEARRAAGFSEQELLALQQQE